MLIIFKSSYRLSYLVNVFNETELIDGTEDEKIY